MQAKKEICKSLRKVQAKLSNNIQVSISFTNRPPRQLAPLYYLQDSRVSPQVKAPQDCRIYYIAVWCGRLKLVTLTPLFHILSKTMFT